MSTKFLNPGWRMPRNANQSKQSNYSMDFDGGSSWITVPTNDSFAFGTGGFTISSWVNFPTDSGQEMILEFRSGGYKLWKQADETILWNKGSLFVQTTTSLSLNTWYLVTVLNTGSSTSIYIDGNLDSSVVSDTASYSASNLYIGKFEYGGYAYRGKMGAVSIFNYPLSSSQITTLYGDSTNGPGNPMALPSPPIAYYPLGTSAWNGQYLAENNAIGDYVFDFDGNNAQSVNCGNDNSLQATTVLTLSAWIKYTTDDTNFRYVLTRRDFNDTNYMLYLNNTTGSKTLKFCSNGCATSSGSVTYNQWHHVAVTVNGTSVSFYIDGQPAGTSTITGINSFADKNFIIGDVSYSTTYEFAGLISNPKMFNTALSSTDVETLYNYGSPIQTLANIPQSSNLKAWYKLDASEIYNSTSTEWEVSDATATIKNTILDPKNSSPRPYYEENNGGNLLPLTGTAGQSITISFWYYASGNADNIIFSRIENSAYWFGKQSTNNLRFLFTNNSGWTLGPSVPRDQWNHIVLTVTESGTSAGRTVKFYVNGGSPTTVTDPSSNLANWSGLSQKNTFGAGSYGSTNVDVLSSNYIYYNTALLDSEVANLYNSFSPDSENTPTVQPALSNFPKNSNITGWFKSDGLDSSGEGNNASSVGNILIGPAVSLLNGTTTGMSQANLIQSDLQTVAPYSKYALSFDGILDTVLLGNAPIVTGVFTISIWIKRTSTSSPESAVTQSLISKDDIGSNRVYSMFLSTSTGFLSFWVSSTGSYDSTHRINTSTAINDTEWHNIVFINNGNNINNQVYVDGAEASYTDQGTGVSSLHYSTINSTACGNDYYAPVNAYCSMSNISMWTSAFSPSQVIEIYNEGLPSNLNSHSAVSSLASWWQLGENSSFDGSNWTCINEVASNNGQTRSVPVSALTNGVGTTANGVSTGMSEGSLIGEAPYSTGNAISSGMPVTARGTDVP